MQRRETHPTPMTNPLHKATAFKFMSLAFAYPNEAFVPALKEAVRSLSGHAGAAGKLIAEFEAADPELLQAEYTRLFINGYPNTPCLPYESVRLEQRMHGDASVSVQAEYQAWGLSVDAGLIDHLSTEFEYLAFLASIPSAEPSLASKAQASFDLFVREHLCRWVPAFISDLESSAEMACYRSLSFLMANLLEGICLQAHSQPA